MFCYRLKGPEGFESLPGHDPKNALAQFYAVTCLPSLTRKMDFVISSDMAGGSKMHVQDWL
jgi:hypothetical protein